MSEPPQAPIGKRRRALHWCRSRKWLLAGLLAGVLLLVSMALAGYRTETPFTRDLLANLVADALVALVAFISVNWAFGLWTHRQQELDAVRIARSMLEEELTANRNKVSAIASVLEDGSRPADAILMEGPPRIETASWQTATDSQVVLRLPVDLFIALHRSYAQCHKLTSADWYSSAKEVHIRSSERGREKLVSDALPHFKTAVETAEDALARLARI